MSPVEPTGGGLIARVLLAALSRAKSRKNPEISESQLVQIAKVTVIGSNASVNVGGPVSGPSGEEIANIISRCFDVVMHQPGLRIAYAVGADGGRTIRIENIAEYQLPDASAIESYTIASSRREIRSGSGAMPPPDRPLIVDGDVVPPSTVPSVAETHVDHEVLARHATDKVNVPSDDARKRRTQVNHLRERLAAHIAAHPDYDLVKLHSAGSTAKHLAIKRRAGEGSDADVAAYIRAASVGGVDADESRLLQWLCGRCQEVYGKTKVADDFKISEHAVGITLRGSGLKIDVAPVLYEDEPDDRGYLITRQGDRVLTSVTLHLEFTNTRKREVGPGYAELIRLLKAWIREAKRLDDSLRCKSFMIELLVAHLWSTSWHGEDLAVNDYPRAFEQVLSYVAKTELQQTIVFDDFCRASDVPASYDPIQIWDPVNPNNNVARTYTDADRKRLVDCAGEALDEISWAAHATTRTAANEAWQNLFGPSFEGA